MRKKMHAFFIETYKNEKTAIKVSKKKGFLNLQKNYLLY